MDFITLVYTFYILANVAGCHFANGLSSHQNIEYVYYEDKLSWNDARRTCLDIGADLASFPSRVDALAVAELMEIALTTAAMKADYWVGLYETEWVAKWVNDCEPAPISSLVHYETHPGNNKYCYFHRPSAQHTGQSFECASSKSFICKRILEDNCTLGWTYSGKSVILNISTTEQLCIEHCYNDSNCVDAQFIRPSSCYTFRNNSGSKDVGHLYDKCANVSVNSTKISYSPADNSDTPNVHCDTVSSEPQSSPTTSIPPAVPSTPISSCQCSSYDSVEPITPTATIFVCFSSTLSSLSIKPSITPLSTLTDFYFSTPWSAIVMSSIVTSTSSASLPSASTSISHLSSSASITHLSSSSLVSSAMPFECPIFPTQTSNISLIDASVRAKEIQQNLTINAKKTSAYARTLTSASDPRRSSAFVGWVGILCVAIPFCLILLSDTNSIVLQFKRKWREGRTMNVQRQSSMHELRTMPSSSIL